MAVMSYKEIRIDDYRYDLPQERIAQFPLENRDQSNLLVFRNGKISQARFFDLPGLLPADSMLIWNDTRVIPARLEFNKPTGALIEIFLLEPCLPADYGSMFQTEGSCTWKTIIGNQKKWKKGPLVRHKESRSGLIKLVAEYVDSDDYNQIKLSWSPANVPFVQILDIFGKTPIPPYLRRESTENDKTRYQTIYANFDGSVAAPTAGLHFTGDLIENLRRKNIRLNSVTLHVGSGTFIPVKTETIGDHPMHAETVIIEKDLIRDLLNITPDKLTVVGTTSLRSLESLFWLGQKLSAGDNPDPDLLYVDQWEPYNHKNVISVQESLSATIHYLDQRGIHAVQFTTRIIIVPGYEFRLVNRLITNFHQPSSTLLLLVSALIGPKWRDIYNYALENNFRFLSYGDSSLLENESIHHA